MKTILLTLGLLASTVIIAYICEEVGDRKLMARCSKEHPDKTCWIKSGPLHNLRDNIFQNCVVPAVFELTGKPVPPPPF